MSSTGSVRPSAAATPPPPPRRGRSGRRRRLRLLPSRKALLLGLLGCLLLLIGAFILIYATTKIPSVNALAAQQTSVITYSNGGEIGRVGAQNRIDIALNRVPPYVRHAVLAAEDRHYYSEPGISPKGILRALKANLSGGEVSQGGSTITQQYAKNAYLTQQRTFTRKFREIFIAIKLDRTRSKNRVFEDYLNTIYFGRGAYGIQTAAETYFNKSVARITPAEGALLAALIRAPSYYDPAVHPAAAQARWRYVVQGMVDSGWLSRAQVAGLRFPRSDAGRNRSSLSGPNGFIVEAVKRELQAHGIDENRINVGGLRIRTTIDSRAQGAAVAAETAVLGSVRGPVSALVAVQPGSGAIRAMYGGRDYTGKGPTAQLNLATQIRRQPGSSFKPYVLATALEQGIGVRTVFSGSSPKFVAGYGPNQMVSNDSGEQCYRCSLLTATERSVNTVYVPLAVEVGPKNVAATAHAAGIPSSVRLADANGFTGPSIALGAYGVRPLDQAVGFATFANHGVAAAPYLVISVLDGRDTVLYKTRPRTAGAFSADVAADATYAMTRVIDGPQGTARRARLANGRPAAGKTGTTQGNTDAWFVGFTPQLCAAVWMGNADNSPLKNVPGYAGGVYGGTLPAEIWKQFMDAALAGQPALALPDPVFLGSTSRGLPPPPPTHTATPTASPTGSASASPSTSPSPAPTRSPTPAPSRSGAPSPSRTGAPAGQPSGPAPGG